MIRLHLSTLRLRCLLRRGGHTWTTRCYPISCARCGTTAKHWLIGDMPDWMRT